MASPYAGNPAVFPTTFLIPDDTDLVNAVSVNVALEALGDRTAHNAAQSAIGHFAVVAGGDSTFIFPANSLPFILVEGCGQGGGGGGGSAGGNSTYECSGGGGGGALLFTRLLGIVPGDTYLFHPGSTGGAGGAGGTGTSGAGVAGSAGEDSVITWVTGSAVLATFSGAQGGQGGTAGAGADAVNAINAVGGAPVRHGAQPGSSRFDTTQPNADNLWDLQDWSGVPSHGENGVTYNALTHILNRTGTASPQSFSGGNRGTTSTTQNGAGGGGGGGGPYDHGGNGGNGGTTSTSGTAGSTPPSNSGAGGGGGGSGGNDGGSGLVAGGAGGSGAAGQIRVVWFTRPV